MSDSDHLMRQLGMGELLGRAARTMETDDVGRDGAMDKADFGQLYLRYRDPVFRYVRRLSGSDDEAADLTARTFERALAKLNTYRGDGAGFAPWLFRIARNQVWDARRRSRPWLPIQLLDTRRHPHEPSTPEGTVLRRESIGEVSRYLDELPETERECLSLRYGAGLTAHEIGLVIGKSDEATQKLMGEHSPSSRRSTVESSPSPRTVEDALRAELQSGPSPAAAAIIDRRVTAALAEQSFGPAAARGWLRRMTVAPVAALVAALVLGSVVVAAALVLTAEDQRVYDWTACMRDRGWDVADPNVENGTGHVVPGSSTIVDDARQPAFNADLEECATNAGIPLVR